MRREGFRFPGDDLNRFAGLSEKVPRSRRGVEARRLRSVGAGPGLPDSRAKGLNRTLRATERVRPGRLRGEMDRAQFGRIPQGLGRLRTESFQNQEFATVGET